MKNYVETSHFYHVSSNGEAKFELFSTEEDFKAAMNRIACCIASTEYVEILSFVLMSNHFHFVLQCTCQEACLKFIHSFKAAVGQSLYCRKGNRHSLEGLEVTVNEIFDINYLRTAICYDIKNPTVARIAMFYDYPWSSGKLYFRHKAHKPGPGSRTIDSLSATDYRKLFGKNSSLPKEWIIEDGIVWPGNYIDIKKVERIFATTKSYMYFLSLNKDEEIEREIGNTHEISMDDTELRQIRNVLIQEMFKKTNITELSTVQRKELAAALRKKYLPSKKQLARIVRLPYAEIEKWV